MRNHGFTAVFLGWLGLFAAASCHVSARSAVDEIPPTLELEARTVDVAGKARRYLLGMPAGVAGPVPLLVALHRRGGSAAQAARDYGLVELGARERFAVAFPETGAVWGWSAGGLPLGSAAADLAFLDALLDTLLAELSIDAAQVFVCGHSSGGILTYDYAQHAPHRVAAIGVVAGTLGLRARRGDPLAAGAPVPLVHVHGTADRQVAYDRENARRGALDWFVSAPDSVRAWARRNGCAHHERVTVSPGVVCDRYADAPAGTGDGRRAAVLYSLADGPHTWPVAGEGAGFDAAAVLWQFFAEPR